MDKLIETIMYDDELSIQDKTKLIERIVAASHGINETVAPGFYLHTEVKNEDTVDMQLWYRNVDESGMTSHGPTNWDSEKIVQFMKTELLSSKKTK